MESFSFGKGDNITYNIQKDKSQFIKQEQLKENKEKKKIEYIWVDGYKGMSKDMKCIDFQYDFGKTYIKEQSIPEYCFYFSRNLRDVFNCCPYDFPNRVFKVHCLVSKEDYEQNGHFSFGVFINNLIAKEIKIISEIPKEELFPIVKKDYIMLESLDEFISITNYRTFILHKFVVKLSRFYSESFAIVLFEEILDKYKKDASENNFENELSKTIKKAIVLAEEGLSKDMCVYLLLCK